ncbi:MAG: pyridoxal 5'-phosphate synthase glutaminase subunit PdxT [Clostridiales bacterium]|nr:pyridoxal 5'-phosphate synthase glutaminase subunit PdxT [Clostridiales bacterium]
MKYSHLTIGILALQGSVIEHEQALSRIGVKSVRVLKKEQLEAIDGLILPGGESTTLGKLLNLFGIMQPLRERIRAGMPVFGTCAGLILLAKEIEGESPHIGTMDISVRRNAYGRQIDSFTAHALIEEFSPKPVELVFIRAPWIEKVYGNARVVAELNGHIIAARQNNMLVTSFHPELTKENAVHTYFADMVLGAKHE